MRAGSMLVSARVNARRSTLRSSAACTANDKAAMNITSSFFMAINPSGQVLAAHCRVDVDHVPPFAAEQGPAEAVDPRVGQVGVDAVHVDLVRHVGHRQPLRLPEELGALRA